MTAKPLKNILIKPAGPDCNLACGYCFYRAKGQLFSSSVSHRMNEQILEALIQRFMTKGAPQLNFSWQGGEPTLMGLPFFQRAMDLIQRYGRGQSIGNGLQTNGLLLDRSWAHFLKKYRFLVGISLDGPAHVHDHYRRRENGRGTWAGVAENTALLLDAGVSVNALAVVNDYSVQFPEEIYGALKDLGLHHMQFIPCVETDPSRPDRAASFSAPAEEYGKFLCTLLDLWLADFKAGVPTTSIRFFDSLLTAFAGMTPPECTLQQECGNYLVVEHNGDVFACDFFVEPQWRLGNVLQDDLDRLLNGGRQSEFGRRKSSLPPTCKTCPWLRYCHGGCPKDRLRDPNDNGVSHFCRSHQIFLRYAAPKLETLARRFLNAAETDRPPGNSPAKIGRNAPCPCGSGKKYKKCCGS